MISISGKVSGARTYSTAGVRREGCGPGYIIKNKFAPHNRNDRGTISMANAGPNTCGSQFFINLFNNNFLDTKYPVFGTVIEGMEVVDAIGKVQTETSDRPLKPLTILKAAVL
jgi:peptidylprolyl isomerase